METDLRAEVLLSVSRALWGQVTPELRGVACRWTGNSAQDAAVQVKFIYERSPSELEIELVSEAESELWADFPDGHVECSVLPYQGLLSRVLEQDEEWVYLRYEPLN